MRVVAFTKTTAIGPSSRYRYEQYREALGRRGVELRTAPLFGPTWFRILQIRNTPLRVAAKVGYALLRFGARIAQLRYVGDAELVIVEHQLFPYLPAWAERWLASRSPRWILEFDDAIYRTRLHCRKMETLCGLADRVVVGNRHLADFARRHAREVSIVPTTIDLTRYPLRDGTPERGGSGPFVIGWIGLPYNFGALSRLREPLRRLSEERPVVLRVVSTGAPSMDGVEVDEKEWCEDREVEEIRRFDVGVMPLDDDEWSRGKCGLKVLQYLAAGVPVVASPVGVNTDIVRHGVNGLLASTDEEWRDALARLLDDDALRGEVVRAGRATVEENYSMEHWVPRLAELWTTTARGPS